MPTGAHGLERKKKKNVEKQSCHDPLEIVNHFNSFTTVAASLARNLPQPFNKYCTNKTSLKKLLQKQRNRPWKFYLQIVKVHFNLSELKKLNIAKSMGPDNIPARFLKDGALVLVNPVTHSINLSIMTNTVPEELKEALVTPCIKKNRGQQLYTC